ncbi:hypothetical protein DPEC_G00043070 [Dallia pectoralis]|uniref:Uncharacterized protein n=1 Tax=Dallia pectoralis TaxID=75939 RepID=A0ACC2H8Y9_DALPE|nr:hypothetical protein DPEC_G00043070 [Dallia pectoralis]
MPIVDEMMERLGKATLIFTLGLTKSTGIGVVLSYAEGEDAHSIHFISRKLILRERNYVTVEREALAIKWALEYLRYYLLGRKVYLSTPPLSGWLGRETPTVVSPDGFSPRIPIQGDPQAW